MYFSNLSVGDEFQFVGSLEHGAVPHTKVSETKARPNTFNLGSTFYVHSDTVVRVLDKTASDPKAHDPFAIGRAAYYNPGRGSRALRVRIVGVVEGHAMRRVKYEIAGYADGPSFPVDLDALQPCAQFVEGQIVRIGSDWSKNIASVDSVIERGNEFSYRLTQLHLADDDSIREEGSLFVTDEMPPKIREFDESGLVAVEFYHVYALRDDGARWMRTLWAASQIEAEDECRREHEDLMIAATIRINGSIVE